MATTTTTTTTRKPRKAAVRKPAAKKVAAKKAAPKKPAAKGLKPDVLSDQELAKEYGYALRVIKADPELYDLFKQASNQKNQWTAQKFTAALMDTNWWRNNNEWARKAFAQRAMGGADWKATKQAARSDIQNMVTTMGANLSQDEMNNLVDQYIVGGWSDDSRRSLLNKAVSKYIGYDQGDTFLGGKSGTLQEELMKIAESNGLKMSPSYYTAAARSVAAGWTTADDQMRELRAQAASLWPSWTEKINAGLDARDLASGYINLMAQEFEIDPNTISLDDPYIRSAMTGMDDKGDPVQLGLWDFQKKLRNDPRWINTSKAQNNVTGTLGKVMQMFGLMGG